MHCSAAAAAERRATGSACSSSSSRSSAEAAGHHPYPCKWRRAHTVRAVSGVPEVLVWGIDDWRAPLAGDGAAACVTPDGLPRPCGPSGSAAVVALGKFDSLHKGHRALAARAAAMGGHPFLLSFSGMSEVLGWPMRLPLVAPCDQARVLRSWAPACGGAVPRLRYVPFSEIRSMSPEEFVRVLKEDLQVAGVVAGSNYRFGYKARGDAATLEALGRKYQLDVGIVDLVGGGLPGVEGEVSSSKVREMLATARVDEVQACLGRPYRLAALVPPALTGANLPCSGSPGPSDNGALSDLLGSDGGTAGPGRSGGEPAEIGGRVFVPAASFLNQPPAPGAYRARLLVRCCDGAQGRENGGEEGGWEGAGGQERTWVVEVTQDGMLLPGDALQLAAPPGTGGRFVGVDLLGLEPWTAGGYAGR